MVRVVLLKLLIVCLCGFLLAETHAAAVTDDIKVKGKTLRYSGIGIRKQLSDNLYIGALHMEVLSSDPAVIANPSNAKRIEIRMVGEKISAKRFGRLWAETIRINNDSTAVTKHEKDIREFMGFFKAALVQGDQLVIQHIQGQGVSVWINSTMLGQIQSDMFMPLLIQTWIGPRPPSDAFKSTILGGSGDNIEDLKNQFHLQVPTPKRVAETKAWGATKKVADTSKKKKKPARVIKQPSISEKQKAEIERKKKQERKVAAQRAAAKKREQEKARLAKVAADKKRAEEKRRKEQEKLQKEREINKAVAEALAKQKKEFEKTQQTNTKNKTGKVAGGPKNVDKFLASRDYEQSLITWVTKRIVYPPVAYKRGLEGKGILKIQISRDGAVREVMVDKSTSSRLLDKEAVKAVKQLSPLPAMPDELPGSEFEFLAPVTFKR